MKNILFIILSMLLLSSCGSDDPLVDGACFSFDNRSCQANPWNKDNGESIDLLKEARKYIESQDINVINMTADLSFHEVVCLACDVCPDGPRYYIEVAEADTAKLRKLDLLSFESSDLCPK